MKCVERENLAIIKRVSVSYSGKLVKKGWAYCPKWKWKQASKPAKTVE